MEKLAQKAGDKIRQGSLRLAMLMTTLIGNGSATGSNPPAESSSSSEKTTITAPAVKTERADSIDTVDMTQLMSEQLISSNKTSPATLTWKAALSPPRNWRKSASAN